MKQSHSLQPREKLLERGPENLSLEELFMILIGTGTQRHSLSFLAKKIVQLGNQGWEHLQKFDLLKVPGIGSAKTCEILATLEIGKRLFDKKDCTIQIISSPEDALHEVRDIAKLKQEHFVCLYLNARNELLSKKTVSIGTLTKSLIHPREVFSEAITLACHGLILAHNHPSGSLEASAEDIAVTERLREAGQLLGIEILDHIIISKNGWRSIM